MLCANKIDLHKYSSFFKCRSYPEKKLTSLLQKYKMGFQEVSAKEGTNIDTMFHEIIDQVISIQLQKKKKFEDDNDLIPPPTT